MVLEKTLKSLFDCKEIKLKAKKKHPKNIQRGKDIFRIARADLLEKTLMLEKIDSRRRKGRQRIRWLGSITTQRT